LAAIMGNPLANPAGDLKKEGKLLSFDEAHYNKFIKEAEK